jgi:hypothetical protein
VTLAPYRRRSATSRGGRLIYSSCVDQSFSFNEFRGLAVAWRPGFDSPDRFRSSDLLIFLFRQGSPWISARDSVYRYRGYCRTYWISSFIETEEPRGFPQRKARGGGW